LESAEQWLPRRRIAHPSFKGITLQNENSLFIYPTKLIQGYMIFLKHILKHFGKEFRLMDLTDFHSRKKKSMEVSVFSLNLNTFVQQVSPACGVSSLVSPITRNDKTLPRGHYGIYLSSRQIT